jgi:uncharacterized protein (TIGR02099 family)
MFGQAGHSLSLQDFSMQTRDGLVLPATTLRETFVPGEKGQGGKVELYAKSLDLHSLANFAEHLPIPLDQRQILIDVAPRGVLKEFTARWQGSYPEISSYSIQGQFANLVMQPQKAQLARAKLGRIPAKAAVPAIPGFENLTGSIDANDKGGTIVLDSQDLLLQLPSYFVDPVMPFKRLQMQANWKFEVNDQIAFQVNKMEFDQDGAVGSITGKHILSMRHGAGQDLGQVDLVGKLTGFDIKTINRFIPEQTPENLRNWLTQALLDGKANDVSLRLKGNLNQFPFQQSGGKGIDQGEFVVKGNILGGKLNFLPGVFAKDGVSPFWPVIDNIKGSFIFDRARMEIHGDTATTNGVPLNKVKAIISDLSEHNAVLQIDGIANGALQGMVNYVKASPVDDWISNFLHDTVALGNAQLNLKLQLPLNSIIDSKVVGVVQLNSVDTTLLPDLPMLYGVTGRVEFNERGLNLNNVKGQALGGPLAGSGGTQKDGAIRIRIDGVASADGIQKHFADVDFNRLTSKLAGASRYQVQINAKKRQTEVIVDSSLQGIALNLPAPLNKTMAEIMPLHFELIPEPLTEKVENAEQRDQIKIKLGSILNAHYWRKKELEKNSSWRVTSGAIAINKQAVATDTGLHVSAEYASLNIDEWRRAFESSSQDAGQVKTSSDRKNSQDFAQYVEPSAFSVVADELIVADKKLDKVVLGASLQSGLWQINLDSKQASGYVTWSQGGQRQDAGHIAARLSRLIIPKSATSEVGELLEGKSVATKIPSVEIVAENFELLDKKFGHLELIANNSVSAQGREWHIDKLSLKNEDAELNATGKWLLKGSDSQTSLNYVLDVANAGKLLDRLEFNEVLRGGKGKMEGEVQWNGLPFVMDTASLSGHLQLRLTSGQFLKVDSGGAKLLGVLSMQSLPRRLTLDFRDVFSEGFAFDTITGNALISQGVAKTENLKMNSLNAAVLMEGSADIARETQDLHVAVVPDLNAGAASVVYGLAVNPVIGLGTFLAQLFFRDPLRRAFTYEYQITGPWKNPVVTKLENKERQAVLDKQKAEQQKNEQHAEQIKAK